MKKEQQLYKFIALIYVVAAVVSAYLVYDHYVIINGENFKSLCSVSSYFDCDAVNSSPYSVFLGIPVATWGLGYYVGATLVAVMASASAYAVREATLLLLPGAAASLLASLLLFLISVTRINAVCLFCSALYGLNFAAAALLTFSARDWISRIPAELRKADHGRMGFFAAILAVALVVTAALTAQMKRTVPFDAAAFEMRLTGTAPVAMDLGHAPRLGATNPVIHLVEFSDFECPFCGRQARELKRILRNYRDKVQLTFFNFPLDNSCNPAMEGRPLHLSACLAARGSWCAHQKGRFDEMAALMFSNQKALTSENLVRWAGEMGLNAREFGDCLSSEDARNAVAADIHKAQSLGIGTTPTFFINGRRYEGLVTVEAIDWILAHPEKLR